MSRTVRLYNIDQAGRAISIQLQTGDQRPTPRLRRGGAIEHINIDPRGYYDICERLGVSFEAAQAIARSPMVRAFQSARRLLVREHPPLEETREREAIEEAKARAAVVKTAVLNPANARNALPPGVRPEAAGVAADHPRQDHAPGAWDPAELEPEPEDTEPEVEVTETGTDEEAEEAEATPAAGDEDDYPSLDWTIARMRRYCKSNGIEYARNASKTVLLKTILSAKAKRHD